MYKQVVSLGLAMLMLLFCVGCGDSAVESPSTAGNATSLLEDTDIESGGGIASDSADKTLPPDNRGISGMNSFALRYTLQNSPFNVAFTDLIPAPDEAQEVFAYQAISTGSGNDGVGFDYSMTLDSDEEIIGATFGAAATTASETQLLQAAYLYFSVVSFVDYDTSNEEDLSAWIETSLSDISVRNDAAITIGDAVYEMYGVPGLTYWLIISKASP